MRRRHEHRQYQNWVILAAAVGLCAALTTGCQTCDLAGAAAVQLCGEKTGTLIDRHPDAELRLVSYNILWNNIFPEISADNAAKFVRVVRALDADVWVLQELGKPRWEEDPDYKDYDAADVAALLNRIAPLPDGRTWHTHMGYDNVIASKYPLRMQATDTNPPGDREQAIALVDLPDGRFSFDLYVLGNHYKCCGGTDNDPRRQRQSDAIMGWIRDAQTAGGYVNLPHGTPIVIAGDLNIVGRYQPVATLVDGNIIGEVHYGPDFMPDWDDSRMTDLHPLHNICGPADYTWRDDTDQWAPGRLDYIVYTDSVLTALKKFVLNTTTMSKRTLRAAGLERLDVTVDEEGLKFDHLPLVVDFKRAE